LSVRPRADVKFIARAEPATLSDLLDASQEDHRAAWFPAEVSSMPNEREAMTNKTTFQSIAPPTPGEAAVAAVTWERRGLLGRLVLISDEVEVSAEEPQRAARNRRAAVAPATRSF
jgi:hypothetical protein